MITAAADYAEARGPAPAEIKLWQNWQRFGIAPRAGGLEDQPAGLLDRISCCLDVIEAIQIYHTTGGDTPGNGAKWAKQHPNEWRIIRTVRKLRNEDPADV